MTAEEFDTDELPPTQYLILEVLAARHRLGEAVWTFPSRLVPQIRKLVERGLVHEMHGVTYGTIRAYLTDAGRKAALWEAYVPPNARGDCDDGRD